MTDVVQSTTQIIGAITGIATLGFTIFVWLKLGAVAIQAQQIVTKTEDIHASAIDILKQTNGIMERSEAKTEIIAHAAGVQEGLAQNLAETVASHTEVITKATAEAAALVLETAAKKAAEALTVAAAAAADKLGTIT